MIGKHSKEGPADRREKPSGVFPEHQHSTYSPDGNTKHFIKKSDHVGRGHEENADRMSHPQGFDWPGDETGEGVDGKGHVYGKPSQFSGD